MKSLVRWDPFTELASMALDELNDALSPFGSPVDLLLRPGSIAPPVDVYDDQEAVHLRMELPGVKIDDVQGPCRGERADHLR